MSSQTSIEHRLQIGSVYLLLFIRDRDTTAGFHWALYHHRTPTGGYKFNVKQIGDVGWLSDSDTNNAIMNAFLLDGALRIGFCDPSQADQLAWINEVDLTRPPPHADKLTCRTWTMHCVRGLIEQGVVKCDDPDALEQEAKEWACLHHKSAYDGVMPRPIEDSRVCTF